MIELIERRDRQGQRDSEAGSDTQRGEAPTPTNNLLCGIFFTWADRSKKSEQGWKLNTAIAARNGR